MSTTKKPGKLTPLYLVDASIYIFRSYFAMPESITNSRGQPANAVYGYASFLSALVTNKRPEYIAAMFDESLDSCFRNELYPDYKCNRALPDPDLARQLNWCRELTELAGIKSYASDRFEADDLIGTAARHLRPHGYRMIYITGDKDLGQLIEHRDHLWDYTKDDALRAPEIRQRFGVSPQQLPDFLGLAGDAVDRIPGVPGVGARTASQLVQRFRSIELMYDYLADKPLAAAGLTGLRGIDRIEGLLRENEQQARLSKTLATIATNAGIRPTPGAVSRKAVKRRALAKWLDENGFGNRLASRLKF